MVAQERRLRRRRGDRGWLRGQVAAGVELILTTGGTGLTPDDVTPEATLAVIEREVPGLAEAMRAESLRYTPMSMLSRAVAGVAGGSLIINFPGSPKAIAQLFPVVAPVLRHAVATLHRENGTSTTQATDAPVVELDGLTRHFGERTVLRDDLADARAGSDARGARPQRRRQVDAAADPGDAAAPARRQRQAVRRAAAASRAGRCAAASGCSATSRCSIAT